ncbi:MAG: hypothetical protein A3A24_01675 [Candidatus Buchananbacteria bacterium RIFCSPLOWO2_01_FULL_46_12]|uniref:DUF3160 domain-containing protein n=2 Tax=Candidatus Buchananiibacteriota TaxID=1817903 RepID=A0A1G1YMG6_9BACT|nr:MAG: hypothetical protein A2744_02890 [Candidatus Buchananbacteria bacterium RIFCSPHIGHO2_01_FULL_44_11]OGY53474.1 MAG: hypothetical protein A3A24_01675 [Candidatus Buchananbacteria bacterium RIFCSPLOWO2_01_FULL_46_12]
MEDKKKIFIIAAVVVVLILIAVFSLFFLLRQKPDENLNQALTNGTETNVNAGGFLSPTLGSLPGNGQETVLEKLAKEKQFISSFYLAINPDYQAKVPQYQLPIINSKETIVNYRDFSRKIDLENITDKLAQNGFIVITNPFAKAANDWQNSYTLIKEADLPILVTADSVLGVYQDTLQVVYKEIEKDFFYPSMWNLLKGLFDESKKRYEVKKQKFGIETNLTAEASRLELAYLTVALRLLQPEPNQVKEVIGTEKEFFSPQEAETYSVKIPEYLKTEVAEEVALINKAVKAANSPVFLYDKDYSLYQVPADYLSSEKLKNYYLALGWLENNLFPLWSQVDDCDQCLTDEQDHPIHFLASLYLTQDLAKNQNLKNRWANIYKSISFFRGLENNLTYLNYDQVLEKLYGADYNLDQIFSTDLGAAKADIEKIQQAIAALNFPKLLGGLKDAKEAAGLRLLRHNHLIEKTIFLELSGEAVGNYLGPEIETKDLPFTACKFGQNIQRCWPTGLDVFNLLNDAAAKKVLNQTKNDQYQNYQNQLSELAAEVKNFDQNTWHDNSYLAVLTALQNLGPKNPTGFPSFMQTPAWVGKNLNAELAALVDAKQQIALEKTSLRQTIGLKAYTGNYGYIEPQIEFYYQLLANVRMIKDGFTKLNIIATTDKTFDRLKNLESILEKSIIIAKKELANLALDVEDYDFINDFDNEIKSVVGDIKQENLQNVYSLDLALGPKDTFNQYLDGLSYVIVVYPDPAGKLFLATGPILNYAEGKNKRKVIADWQKDFQANN